MICNFQYPIESYEADMSGLVDPILNYTDVVNFDKPLKVIRKRVHSKAYHDCYDRCTKVLKFEHPQACLQAQKYAQHHCDRWEKMVTNIDVD